jgi:hypothetical protein
VTRVIVVVVFLIVCLIVGGLYYGSLQVEPNKADGKPDPRRIVGPDPKPDVKTPEGIAPP